MQVGAVDPPGPRDRWRPLRRHRERNRYRRIRWWSPARSTARGSVHRAPHLFHALARLGCSAGPEGPGCRDTRSTHPHRKMNQQCKVCGEPAAGFHFGAFTCEGCKSFFGRTYNNLGSISECKNNGECVINKKNRTACKACRLRKCLMVGMSKSGSRYGRRSNWFKIHCLIQEQQQQAGAVGLAAAAATLFRPHPYLPFFQTPPSRETRNSESDSGASSADIDDESRSAFGGSLKATASPSSVSDKQLPSPASDSECVARRRFLSAASAPPATAPAWPPLTQRNAWKDVVWMDGPVPIAGASAPDQDQPIDLSVRSRSPRTREDSDFSIDISVEEPLKAAAPLDLTLDRQADVVSN